MRRLAPALAALVVFAPAALAQAPGRNPVVPVNPNVTPEARALLAYLHTLGGPDLLAGQHNYNEGMDRFSDSVAAITGERPALWGTDFILNGTHDPGPRIVAEAIRKHRAGYVVTLMWHAGRPTDEPPFGWRESVQADLTADEWRALTTPGTPLHARWLRQVDTVAGYLRQLRDANVPVLWRPYHEMNGVWFWWGDKPGADGYQRLYRMLYDRFTGHHGLNNLLWVWNANAPRDIPADEARDYAPFYPGPDVVDVLATDVYNLDYEQRDYQQLVDLAAGKVVALGEVGGLPNAAILAAQPKWAWFMVWANWLTTHNTRPQVRAVYAAPTTLTLGRRADRR